MSSPAPTMRFEIPRLAPRRAKDAVKGRERRPPEALFDVCWREGELALLFGEPGSGKSVLAVQIAESLARGEPLMQNAQRSSMQNAECTMHNLRSKRQKKRMKTLYIDLVLSEKQFRERYAEYKFDGNLYRETPFDGEDLFEFVAEMVARWGFRAVIIDDLSLVSRTADGTQEALALMHALRQMTVDRNVSVLVLADTYPFVYENQSPERGLRRSRVLCGVADSVFALYDGQVIQTRSRSGEKVWTEKNKLRYRIEELDDGMLGMVLEPPEIDDETIEQIVEIKRMHDRGGKTFRQIAAEIEISKSQAQRLYSQWTSEIEASVTERRKQEAREQAHQAQLDAWVASGGKITYDYKKQQWVKAPKTDPDS